jgi:hypothetical protein
MQATTTVAPTIAEAIGSDWPLTDRGPDLVCSSCGRLTSDGSGQTVSGRRENLDTRAKVWLVGRVEFNLEHHVAVDTPA